jgi:hypothetical protein
MQITQRQKDELERQRPKIERHRSEIVKLLGKPVSRMPSSLDDFSQDEAQKVLNFLKTVN